MNISDRIKAAYKGRRWTQDGTPRDITVFKPTVMSLVTGHRAPGFELAV